MNELLTVREAATRARISDRSLNRHLAAGSGPDVIRLGRRVLIKTADLDAWIALHAVAGVDYSARQIEV